MLWIISYLVGSLSVFILFTYGVYTGERILKEWDPDSVEESQLKLEERNYLISTILKFALIFKVLSLPFFIGILNSIASIIPGAMCAVGSINSNIYGLPDLILKILGIFLYGGWVVINGIDSRLDNNPLIRIKYRYLIYIFPVALTEMGLDILYFLNVKGNILTSCCGSIFDIVEGSKGYVKIIPDSLLMILVLTGIFILFFSWFKRYSYLYSITSLILFILSIISIISLISPYIYGLPFHHCPFCLFKSEFYYIGYPLYGSLFISTFSGIMIGVFEKLKEVDRKLIESFKKKYFNMSILWWIIFLFISASPIILSKYHF
jgi:hypothetical protein